MASSCLWVRLLLQPFECPNFYQLTGSFPFIAASRSALGPAQHPTQWVLGFLYVGVKRPGREADHLHPPSAEIKNAWSYTSIPSIRLNVVVLS